MLGYLAKNEIPELLWLMTEMQNSTVFTDKGQLFRIDVNDQLCALNGIIPRSNNADLKKEEFKLKLI